MKKIQKTLSLTLLCAAAIPSIASAATYTWDGDAGNGFWAAQDTNWDAAPTFDNTADIKIAGIVELDQQVRTNVTIRSLEFTSTNLGATTVGMIAGNGTTSRNLTFSADAGNSTLTIDAASTGVKTFNNTGYILLNSNLDIVHNGADNLVFDAEIRGAGNLSLTGGTTDFSGINIYTGSTTINAATTLNLLAGSEMAFTIGADGINNSLLGAGTLTLAGGFSIDLTGAGTNVGDSWNIVNVATLTETFEGTFSVDGFTNAAGIWSTNANGVDYEFSQLTGDLAVVPEPGTYALLAGLTGLVFVMVRRRRA